MARPKSKAPSLRCHISGQSVCTIDGRDFYLGPHNSAESLARYAVLIREYQSSGLALPDGFDSHTLADLSSAVMSPLPAVQMQEQAFKVRHVTAAYREHAKSRYANSPEEAYRVKQLGDVLDQHYGDVLADSFGPKMLREQRDRWVADGKARTYCNRLTNSVIRMFRWAVSEELVSDSTLTRLRSLNPLREGQTIAPERDEIKPVRIDYVQKTVEELTPIVKAMVRVHIATGMRPSELCNMRPCDIDRTGSEWIYRPPHHKNRTKGKTRAIPILGDAKEAILDYMNRPADAYLFSPAEADAWIRAKQASERKGYGSYKKKSANPRRRPGDRYTAMTYCRAIVRAAKRAGVPPWHPYQLRHLVATEIRDSLGPEQAQALLGHAHIRMTEHYAKVSERKAIEAAKNAPTL